MNTLPTFDQLMNPLLKALRDLGRSGSIAEIDEKVLQNLALSDQVLSSPYNSEKSNKTEIGYRLAWARSYLKKYGIIRQSKRGVWAISPDQQHVTEVVPREVVKAYPKKPRKDKVAVSEGQSSGLDDLVVPNPVEEQPPWREELQRILTQDLDPSAFERLIQLLLRESGFIQVEVTGKSGDGGIDGKGIARIHGLLSFHVHFQCKRYKGSVSAGEIRDFRGAMMGRADKGLFVTTGTFTREAVKEATRDGAPPIDLIDGEELAAKLKELSLGVRTQRVEKVTIDQEWFKTI